MTAGKVSVFVLAVGTAIGLAATLVGQEPHTQALPSKQTRYQ